MDIVLEIFDSVILDRVYAKLAPAQSTFGGVLNATLSATGPRPPHLAFIPHSSEKYGLGSLFAPVDPGASAWPRDYVPRQMLSLIAITLIGIHVLYFLFAWLSYRFIFNHDMMRHPRFLKNQIRLEIISSLQAFPVMTILTLPWFQAEVMGYSRLYENVDDYGWAYFFFSVPFFLLFTDLGIYWIHRWEHHPRVYKYVHKPHHKWIIPTPFASHAFHPFDGYLQSIPYHVFSFVFPLHKKLFLGLFVFVNFWTIFIHDSDMITDHWLENFINGPAHHTLHHMHFNVNYGQYFTWADRTGGSYRKPRKEDDPLHDVPALRSSATAEVRPPDSGYSSETDAETESKKKQ